MTTMNKGLLVGLAASVALALVGCAADAPRQLMAQADYAVRDASEPGIREHAPAEVALAREKYQRAKQAMDEEEYVEARRLAEQAIADARLAQTKARSQRAQQAVKELMEAIDSLRQEINRAQRGA